MSKIVVIGGGPAGMFAAYELSKNGQDVTLIESGLDVEDRKKAIAKEDSAGPHYISGIGGSGTFSDGKLNLHPQIGGDLTEFATCSEAESLISYIDDIFTSHGVTQKTEISPEARKLEIRAMKAGLKYVPILQKHIGSDVLPSVVQFIYKEMRSFGLKTLIGTQATDIIIENSKISAVKIRKEGRNPSFPRIM